ncbi:unnamed protein product [marine sediment metagenome]|uniref:Uncharacterized protein n=1 Tax=marine sediment metagenome TaxID=412755 RepID=X0W607_9ZZZZ
MSQSEIQLVAVETLDMRLNRGLEDAKNDNRFVDLTIETIEPPIHSNSVVRAYLEGPMKEVYRMFLSRFQVKISKERYNELLEKEKELDAIKMCVGHPTPPQPVGGPRPAWNNLRKKVEST